MSIFKGTKKRKKKSETSSSAVVPLPSAKPSIPRQTLSLNGNPSPAVPTNGAPVQAAPVEAAPVEAAPVQAAPVEAAPVQAAPVKAAPAKAAPAKAAPAKAAPAKAAPAKATTTISADPHSAVNAAPISASESTKVTFAKNPTELSISMLDTRSPKIITSVPTPPPVKKAQDEPEKPKKKKSKRMRSVIDAHEVADTFVGGELELLPASAPPVSPRAVETPAPNLAPVLSIPFDEETTVTGSTTAAASYPPVSVTPTTTTAVATAATPTSITAPLNVETNTPTKQSAGIALQGSLMARFSHAEQQFHLAHNSLSSELHLSVHNRSIFAYKVASTHSMMLELHEKILRLHVECNSLLGEVLSVQCE